jgi:diguanylate cyclase (GGDEF)-like protein
MTGYDSPVCLASTDPKHPRNLVLVVEDSRAIRQLLCGLIDLIDDIASEAATSYADAKGVLDRGAERIFCAVLDLNLPDAPNGEIVDLVREHGIPVVVLTGSVDRRLRETMVAKQVIDYVVKGNATEIEHVASIVGRLYGNQAIQVLVVDDSVSFRAYVRGLLEHYRYHVLTAANGREALEVLDRSPDVALVITDYNMPEMNGLELVQAIRREHRREDLAVIGLSDASKKGLSALLLKTGCNDFLAKPFEVEEFFCRVTQNTNMIRYVRQIREQATRDFLTGVYNRRSLYEVGGHLYASAQRGSINLAAALVDADHFKQINDTWGHQVGDDALRRIASTMAGQLRKTDVVARYGGEEFVCLAPIREQGDERVLFERIRAAISAIDLQVGDRPVPIAASIGVTTWLGDSIETMLKRADDALYEAKQAGRNRVMFR